MNLLTIALYVFAGIGALTVILVSWLWFSSPKTEVTEKEPEYTEEEKFLAEILLMKHDLDADKFATEKQILNELNTQEQGGTFYKKMRDAFNPKD